MACLLQIDFPFNGPFGEHLSEALAELARSINDEPGFLWKIWTENESEKQAGGIYLFQDEALAASYVKKHTDRLTALGIQDIRSRLFSINEPLSNINHAPGSCFR